MRNYLAALIMMSFYHALITSVSAQQIADSAFTYHIDKPAYSSGTGPVITLDEAHFNFHTLSGRYYTFGKVLEQDGYVLRSGVDPFSSQELMKGEILVIANALPDNGEWILPTKPAFTTEEVKAVHAWVTDGGSLFLIADHMPFPGAAEELAAVFGFIFINGFAIRTDEKPEIFSRTIGNLHSSPITNGRVLSESIDSIILFTGQGFEAPGEAIPIVTLDTNYTILLPTKAWEFDEKTPRQSGKGLVAGAALEYGKGHVVIMGEAAMFSAQLAGPNRQKMGMNHPIAKQNAQFLLNIIHWLDRNNKG